MKLSYRKIGIFKGFSISLELLKNQLCGVRSIDFLVVTK